MPRGLASSVSGHVVVEAFEKLGVLSQESLEGLFGAVTELEGAVSDVVRILVACVLEKLGNCAKGWTGDFMSKSEERKLSASISAVSWYGHTDR